MTTVDFDTLRAQQAWRDHRGVYLDFAPLESWLVAYLGRGAALSRNQRRGDVRSTLGASVEELAELSGVTPRTYLRWRDAGSIPWDACDDIAVRVGLHPLNLWPDFHAAADEHELARMEQVRRNQQNRNARSRAYRERKKAAA